MMRRGGSLIKMLFLMVLTALLMLIGFSIYANWDKDANGDGQPDGFTLRLFDLGWYGMARDTARPMAQDLKKRMVEIKAELLADDGLLNKSEEWYQRLITNDQQNNVRVPENTHKKREQRKPDGQHADEQQVETAEQAVQLNDPDQAYVFDSRDPKEKPTLHLEDDILEAGQHFRIGLRHYRHAFDEQHELKPGFEHDLHIAEDELREAQRLLHRAVPEYGKRADGDPEFYKRSNEVMVACDELLEVSFDGLRYQ